jgi:hypothetical protein
MLVLLCASICLFPAVLNEIHGTAPNYMMFITYHITSRLSIYIYIYIYIYIVIILSVPRLVIPKKEYSQRDLLLEALDTELINFKWLK